jgi:release factor glutamine methyltransferase
VSDADDVLVSLDASFRDAGVRGVLLGPVDRRKAIEVLVPRRRFGEAVIAADGLRWRWRYGGDDRWRWGPHRVYRLDGGWTVIVHRALSTAPWPPGALGGLARAIWAEADREPGVRAASPAATLVIAAVEAARDRFRSTGRLEALAELADATPDVNAAMEVARASGVEPLVAAALRACRNDAARIPVPGPPGPPGARALRGIARRLPGLRDLASGQPVGHAVVRCRTGGIEVLCGPGVFLPRGAVDGLVAAALETVPEEASGVVIDAGTSCGAAALAVVAARPGVVAIGTDTDPEAIRWATRNAHRLRLRARFLIGSLLEPVLSSDHGQARLVFGNLPSMRAGSFEAQSDAAAAAYVGEGDDGLGLHRTLARQARDVLAPGGHLVLQMAGWQWERFVPELETLGYEPRGVADLGVAVAGTARLSGVRA